LDGLKLSMLKYGFSGRKVCKINNQARSVTIVPLEAKPVLARERKKLHAYFKHDVPTAKAERWAMNHQLEVLARVQQVSKMEELFQQMTSTVGHDSQSFIAMLHVYTANNDMEAIEKLLRIMKKEKVRPTENFYMRLVQVYYTLGETNRIASVLNEMEAAGIKFRVKSVNQLMHIYCMNQNYSAALRLYEQMSVQQILPNRRTFNLLMYIYLKQGNMQQVSNVLNMMREKDLSPDTYAFNILLSETLNQIQLGIRTVPGIYQRVDDILDVMRRFGDKVHIKMSTVLIILKFWIVRARHVNETKLDKSDDETPKEPPANEIILEGEYSIKPEARTKVSECIKMVKELNLYWVPEYVRYLIMFYTSEKKIDVAAIHDLLEEMASKEMAPTKSEFHYLLSCMVKFEPQNVNSILNLMGKFKVKPVGKTYALLMSLEERNFDAVERIAKDMREAGVKPDHAYYFQYIRLAIQNNRDEKVPQILLEMGKDGLAFDISISKLLFKKLLKRKVYSHCMTILEELIQNNAPYVPNIDMLMREFIQLGDLEAAEELVKNLMDSNVSFNLINVADLIKAHVNRGDQGYALHLSVYFINRYKSNPLPEFQNNDIFQIYYRTIKLMQTMNVTSMQAYRLKTFKDYCMKVPPYLWDEQTSINFFSLLESVYKENYAPQPNSQPKRIERNIE
jgi:pentatricopeptide repeat protein